MIRGATHLKDVIDIDIGVTRKTTTEKYLNLLKNGLKKCETQFKPDFVVYNAGSDIVVGDGVGGLIISKEGVIERDLIVFKHFIDRNIPILYLTSGGYCKGNAKIIADSIKNMIEKLKLKEIAQQNYKKNILKNQC